MRSLPAGRAQLLVRGVRGLGGYREGWRRAGGGWGGLTFKLTLAGRPTVLSLSLRRQVHLRRIVGHRAVGGRGRGRARVTRHAAGRGQRHFRGGQRHARRGRAAGLGRRRDAGRGRRLAAGRGQRLAAGLGRRLACGRGQRCFRGGRLCTLGLVPYCGRVSHCLSCTPGGYVHSRVLQSGVVCVCEGGQRQFSDGCSETVPLGVFTTGCRSDLPNTAARSEWSSVSIGPVLWRPLCTRT